ncbi:hypothetical protein [Actinomadura nitritigenes]|uniref:hypothetical protein n=1 Tax=Actinomadura nitritigenes TaxID=134602 RepID=UPI003D91BE16
MLARSHGAGGSWHYFATGATVLFGDDRGEGLHLYATHPELQIGPLSFAVALPLDALGPSWGRTAAVFLMSCTGPLLLSAIWRLVPVPHRRPERLLTAGLVFLPIWAELATHAGHLDDVLALSLAIGALHARARDRPVLAGLLVGAATDAKPWALALDLDDPEVQRDLWDFIHLEARQSRMSRRGGHGGEASSRYLKTT